jgi:hypothetical protein
VTVKTIITAVCDRCKEKQNKEITDRDIRYLEELNAWLPSNWARMPNFYTPQNGDWTLCYTCKQDVARMVQHNMPLATREEVDARS